MNELYRKKQHFESSKVKVLLEKSHQCQTRKLKGTTIFSENFSGHIHFMKKGQMFVFTEDQQVDEDSEVPLTRCSTKSSCTKSTRSTRRPRRTTRA